MSDRQMGTSLITIEGGHKNRYKFACSRVNGYVLDAACGVGYGSKMMAERATVTGVDIEPEAIKIAEEYYSGPDFRIGNVSEEHGTFDWVVSFETIEHVSNPYDVLIAFRTQAENLIISTPNEELNPFDAKKFEGAKYPHLRHYTPKEFEDMLNDCGWHVTEKLCQITKRSEVTRGTGAFLVWVCR